MSISFYQRKKNAVDRQVQKKSARAKVKLLANGVKDNPEVFGGIESFKEEHYAYDNGNWGVTKGRLIPSEVLLPGGIVSKLHIRPESPLSISFENGRIFITENGNLVSECETLKRPSFWDYKLSCGTPTKKLAHFYGATCINFNIFSGCQFFNVDRQCHFCSVQETQKIHRGVEIVKSAESLKETCELAVKNDEVEWFLMTGGSFFDRDREFDRHIRVLDQVRNVLPWQGRLRGNVSMMPPSDLGRLVELFELGVDHPSFNLEVWPQKAFERICPGKQEYVGFDHIMKAYDQIVKIYGPGRAWCNFVAGLVPLKDQKEGFTVLAEKGVIPGANIYHPDVGSVISNSISSPSEAYIIELYMHASELYHRYDYKPFFDASVLRNSLANEAYEGLLS